MGRAVKRAIDEGLVKRKDLFIVSKLWVQDMVSEEAAAKAIQTSLDNLGIDYIDAYVIIGLNRKNLIKSSDLRLCPGWKALFLV